LNTFCFPGPLWFSERINIISTARLDRTSVLLYVDEKEDDIVLVEIALRYAAIPFRLRQFDNIAAATAYLKGEGSFADRAVPLEEYRGPLPTRGYSLFSFSVTTHL
jgi:hypothetical protein